MPSRSSWLLSRRQYPHQLVEYMVSEVTSPCGMSRASWRLSGASMSRGVTRRYRPNLPCNRLLCCRPPLRGCPVMTSATATLAPGSAADVVLAGLDPEQREVATALQGPVCVLAGAGPRKNRAGTH